MPLAISPFSSTQPISIRGQGIELSTQLYLLPLLQPRPAELTAPYRWFADRDACYAPNYFAGTSTTILPTRQRSPCRSRSGPKIGTCRNNVGTEDPAAAKVLSDCKKVVRGEYVRCCMRCG